MDQVKQLDPHTVEAVPGQAKTFHAFGGGLYLGVTRGGARSWFFLFTIPGKKGNQKVRLGKLEQFPTVEKARNAMAADAMRRAAGKDPRDQRKIEREAEQEASARIDAKKTAKVEQAKRAVITVKVVGQAWLEATKGVWTGGESGKTYGNNASALTRIYAAIGERPIDQVSMEEVGTLLTSVVESGRLALARKVYQVLVLVWAHGAAKFKVQTNPVAPLAKSFHTERRVALKAKPAKHHPCVNPRDRAAVRKLLQDIRTWSPDNAGRCTKAKAYFSLLTGVRPQQESRKAQWSEFDLEAGLWVIPASRMKNKNQGDHTVPLSRQAIALLKSLPTYGKKGYVFVNQGPGPMDAGCVNEMLENLGYKDRQVEHGFRTIVSSSCHAQFDRRIAQSTMEGYFSAVEMILHHFKNEDGSEKSEVQLTYDRADYLEERREIMQWWADEMERIEFGADVVPLKRAG